MLDMMDSDYAELRKVVRSPAWGIITRILSYKSDGSFANVNTNTSLSSFQSGRLVGESFAYKDVIKLIEDYSTRG